MPWPPRTQIGWGFLGALAAGAFAIWMFFFPDAMPTYFAWDVQPRYAQAFIGAGYVFRTAFFLYAMRPGELAATALDRLGQPRVHRDAVARDLLAHRRVHVEPVPDAVGPPLDRPVHLRAGGDALPDPARHHARRAAADRRTAYPGAFRSFLVFVTGLALMFGLLLVINPEFAANRWPWELNPLDARIVAAWFLGWSFWCGTMAFARDWDEIRAAAALFILNLLALVATLIVFRDGFLERGTLTSYGGGIVAVAGLMIAFFVLQERRRPAEI